MRRSFGTGVQLLKRLAILSVFPVVGWLSVATTGANVLREKTPDVALKLSPNDAGALAKRNDFNLRQDKDSGNWTVSERDARASLRSQGLNARAIRQLAFVAENKGDGTKAKVLIAKAEKMSRRDIGVQLWMANHLAAHNDIKGALRHIDTGLRSAPESRALLFPLLMQALDDKSFQAEFAPYVSSSPSWIAAFIDYALTARKNLDILSQSIVVAGGLPSGTANDVLNQQMLNHLASGGHYSEIAPYFAKMRRADTSLFTDTALKPSSIDPRNGPLAWSAVQTVDVDAAIVQAGNGQSYQIDINIGPEKRRVAAQKLLYLAPGQYRFKARHAFDAGGGDSAISWDWQCVSDSSGEPLFSHAVHALDVKTTGGVAEMLLNIPNACSIQVLKITAVGGSASEDTRMTIRQLQLSKL